MPAVGEKMVRALASTALRRDRYEVLEAANGKQALDRLANSGRRPSLVLLDLATACHGAGELAPILEAECPGLEVILTSGYPEADAREGYRSANISGFLQKPYAVSALTEKSRKSSGPARRSRSALEFKERASFGLLLQRE